MSQSRRSRGVVPMGRMTFSLSHDCIAIVYDMKKRNINVSEIVENFLKSYEGVSEVEVARQELDAEILTLKAQLFEREMLKRARENEQAKQREKQMKLKAEGKLIELDLRGNSE